MPFRQLVDRVVVVARGNFRRLFFSVGGPLLLASLLISVAQIRWTQSMVSTLNTSDTSASFFVGIFLLFALVIIGVLITYSLTFSALLVCAMDGTAGREVHVGHAWKKVLSLPMIVTLVLISVLTFLSLLMCLLPSLLVVPLLAFALPVAIEEEKYGFAAVGRSVELARLNPTGHWRDSVLLQIFVFMFIAFVISNAVTSAVQLPFLIAQQVLVFRDAAGGQGPEALTTELLWLQVPTQMVAALATAATWFYWTFGIAMLYRETLRRHRAEDLQITLDQLTGAAAPQTLPSD